ncbi:MAG: hypothetical protein A2X49_04510 [Lentisphaerae bacterium GWF2_52_8]|nr:MAG: hypothetical protein A2X49_04510 [Lentisphaerae bacterium GWF2_52_8]
MAANEGSILKKLAQSPLVMNFVESKGGYWDHQDWLDFLSEIRAKGYGPIELDKLGLLLEAKKAEYLATQKA